MSMALAILDMCYQDIMQYVKCGVLVNNYSILLFSPINIDGFRKKN